MKCFNEFDIEIVGRESIWVWYILIRNPRIYKILMRLISQSVHLNCAAKK